MKIDTKKDKKFPHCVPRAWCNRKHRTLYGHIVGRTDLVKILERCCPFVIFSLVLFSVFTIEIIVYKQASVDII